MNKNKISLECIIYFVLLAAVIVSLFKDVVNYTITYKILPMDLVTVITEADTEHIVGEDNRSNSWYEKMGWNVQKDYLLEKSQDGDKYVWIYAVIVSPTQCITIPITSEMKTIAYSSTRGLSEEHNITDTERGLGAVKIFPFANNWLKIGFQLLIYIITIAVVFLLIYSMHIHLLSEKRIFGKIWEYKYNFDVRILLVIWLILYLVALGQYVFHIGTPYYMPDNALGDQAGYWNTYIFKHGFFDFDYMATLATFRGYMVMMPTTIARCIAAHIGFDPVKVYLLFPTFVFSWFGTWIVPQLYYIATKHKPKLFSLVVFILLNAYFWNWFLIGAMTDYYSVAIYFAFLLYLAKTIKTKQVKPAMLAGLFFGMATNWRVSYWHESIIFLLLYLTVDIIENRNMIRERIKSWMGNIKIDYKRILVCTSVFIICFFIVALPQAITNNKNHHIGVLPYDSRDAYAGYPVTWSGWNTFFFYGMVLWPNFIGDDQLMTMKEQLYGDRSLELYPQQAIDVYSNSPLEFVSCIVKKMFTILDLKTNINYDAKIWYRNLHGLLFSFLNYLTLIISIYCLIKYKEINMFERRWIWMIFIALVLPYLYSHCEWRTALPAYVILYFIFSYYFQEIIMDNKIYKFFCDEKFYRTITIGIILSFIETLTLWSTGEI
ncbi:MAG: hypothetical protein IJ682_03720 [Lachnospiraceae bacterium]|nr:hypothetical protein [Lachnospiraceae bacterium]